MSYVAVLPYVYQPYFDACIATCRLPTENLLVVDNTVRNLGIMRSHNMGIDRMREVGADWLIIISAAIRFGDAGGLDFIDVLESRPGHYIIHAATANVPGGAQHTGPHDQRNGVFGWHLTGFRREVFDNIGRWDENFTPYGLDDIDLSLRIQKHYKGAKNDKGEPGWDTFPCDVHDTTMSHSINLAGVVSPYPPLAAYFTRKWGRAPEDWQQMGYDTPFNLPEASLAYWPDSPNGGRWDA